MLKKPGGRPRVAVAGRRAVQAVACADGEAGELANGKKNSGAATMRSGPSIVDRTAHVKRYARPLRARGSISAADFETDGSEEAGAISWSGSTASVGLGRVNSKRWFEFEFFG